VLERTLLLISIALSCASCSEPPQTIEIPFFVGWAGEPLACDDGQLALSDLRLYAADIELLAEDGSAHRLQKLAFIDLEDGSASCQNGTTELSAIVAGSAPDREYNGLRFTLGVPFESNHADPLSAPAPLDNPAMHWHWRSGYKFLRAGVRTVDDGFWIHLGSAGCEGTVGNITGCRFPNRVSVELAEFDPLQHRVMIDLQALMGGVDLLDGERSDCSSGPPETSCIEPFRALGIDFETGETIGRQQLFSVSR